MLRRSTRVMRVQFCSPTPGWHAFVALGAIVLAVTGAEALYADMGHFGRDADPPRLVRPSSCPALCSTISARVPCCCATPGAARNPFYRLAPALGAVSR